MKSNHYRKQRNERQSIIDNYTNGEGKILERCYIDKGHKDGAEIHCITENAIIIIFNAKTRKMVTKLIARPEQIKRIYKIKQKEIPQYLLDLALWHQKCGYNKI